MQDLSSLPAAPQWATFVGIAGKALVFIAIVAYLASAIGWIKGWEKVGKVGFWIGSLSIFGTFTSLASLFLNQQFQYEYVFSHSEAGLALKYQIAAIWSGQQGSFLLWAVCAAIFGLLAAPATGLYRRWFTVPYAIFLSALAAILAYETPFDIIPELVQQAGKIVVPPTGQGLTPSLQNYWVVIHPPTIFLGFGSLTVMFCWAISAMMNRNPIDWVKMMRPWVIASTAILGLGLMMGGFWAYETLGWGGFWAWDPVENVSFVPWVFGVALIHGLLIQINRGRYVGANMVLAGLPFILFVYGTFLTRSGFLGDTSVHSFAEMKRGALWVLMGFGAVTFLGFFGLYFAKGRSVAKEFEKPGEANPTSRESLYRTGIVLLCGLAAATAFGMSVPWLSSILLGRVSKAEPWLYHQVLSWAFVPIMLLLAITPFASWRGLGWKDLMNRIVNILTISVGLTGLTLLYLRHPEWGLNTDQTKTTVIAGGINVPTVYWVSFLIFLSLFVIVGNTWRIVESLKRSPMSIGGFISHFGLAVFLAGMVLSSGLEQKERLTITRSRPAEKMGFKVSLKEDPKAEKLFDRDNKVLFDVDGPDGKFIARPGLYYTGSAEDPKPMVWPHIERYGTHDVYFTMGAPAMNFWEKPEFFKPGETKTINDVTVTYHGYEMVGEPGKPGTKFVGKVTVAYDGERHEASPAFSIGDAPTMPVAGEFRVMLGRIDAATKGAEIQLYFREAVYPIELYYKPMTGLVWAGAGILFIGGLLSAVYRRNRKPTGGSSDPEPLSDLAEPEPIKEDAPAPVA